MIKTVKCKLIMEDAQSLALTETIVKFAAACNEISDYARRQNIWHKFKLSALYYRYVRDTYGLTASYCVRVFDRVAASKGERFQPTSILIDKDLFTRKSDECCTISTCSGRIPARLAIGEYQRKLLGDFRRGPGTINIDRHGRFFANICVEVQEPQPTGSNPLGVDLGIRRIATLSTGQMFSGRKLNHIRERYARTKASMQRRGTKGAKRALKRLAGRERRFQRETNHVISRKIVAQAKHNDSFICLEDLKGIRQRVSNQGRRSRRMMGRWAFYQLRSYLTYKGQETGVPVVLVNPAYTSKTCPDCRLLGHRNKLKFSCSCGFVGDADIVGALNIAALGAQANRPEVARV
jgi:putative transposase